MKDEVVESADFALGIAERVLASHFQGGAHLLHLADDHFWHFNGRYWEPVSDRWIEGIVVNTLRNMPSRGHNRIATVVREVVSLLRATQTVKGDPLRFVSEPLRVINCRNGEVWLLDNGDVKLKPHRAGSHLRQFIDVDYIPSAKCPKYDGAVAGIFRNARCPKSMVRHWNELAGYIIQPTRAHAVIAILFGSGSNGKTRLITTVMSLLGPDLVYAGRVEELEADRFGVGSLLGKQLFVDDDVRADIKLPDGALKKISEQKELTGEKKFKDKFNFKSRVVPVLLCNNVPSLPDLTHGMLRRLQIIPMTRRFTGKKDKRNLFNEIWATEMSGVLNRVIRGWQRLHRRGQFKLPKDVVRAQRRWLVHANPLKGFIDERCTIDPATNCLLADFYREYGIWAKDSGVTSMQPRLSIKRNLGNLGYASKRSPNGIVIVGIGINWLVR